MEKYILDTCTWIEFFHERNGVKERVVSKDIDQIFASEITLAELTYGAMNSADYERHVRAFHSQYVAGTLRIGSLQLLPSQVRQAPQRVI